MSGIQYKEGMFVSVYKPDNARFFQGMITKASHSVITVQNGSKVKTFGITYVSETHEGEPPSWYKPRPVAKKKNEPMPVDPMPETLREIGKELNPDFFVNDGTTPVHFYPARGGKAVVVPPVERVLESTQDAIQEAAQKPKRHRRTNAQIAADNAALEAAKLAEDIMEEGQDKQPRANVANPLLLALVESGWLFERGFVIAPFYNDAASLRIQGDRIEVTIEHLRHNNTKYSTFFAEGIVFKDGMFQGLAFDGDSEQTVYVEIPNEDLHEILCKQIKDKVMEEGEGDLANIIVDMNPQLIPFEAYISKRAFEAAITAVNSNGSPLSSLEDRMANRPPLTNEERASALAGAKPLTNDEFAKVLVNQGDTPVSEVKEKLQELREEQDSEQEDELQSPMDRDALQPEVYNAEVMGARPEIYVLPRLRIGGQRHYPVYFKNLKRLDFLPGTTSVDETTSEPPTYLTKWRYDMAVRYNSIDAVDGYVDDTAAYGTILHSVIARFMQNEMPDFGSQSWFSMLEVMIRMQEGRDPASYIPIWDRRLRKDILAWNKFLIDKNVKVHMMEYAGGSLAYGVGFQIDIVCTLDFNKGRVNAIIDVKSGKKLGGQGNSKATQLAIYKLAFDDIFPNWKHSDTDKSPEGITKVFNWHPSDWSEEKGIPTYELVNQTDNIDWKEVRMQLDLFSHRSRNSKPGLKTRLEIEGALSPFDASEHLIKSKSHRDTYIERYNLEVEEEAAV